MTAPSQRIQDLLGRSAVKADRAVRYERIGTVRDALKQADARLVFLLSEQQTDERHY